jgi:rhodanese-related sulfurtransferase
MSYQEHGAESVKALLDEGWVYVDVRTVEEFEEGHVPGAYNVPILFRTRAGMQPNPEFVDVVRKRFLASDRLVFGCRSGGRSRMACELLAREGFRHLVNQLGGFHGLPDPTGRIVEPGWAACGLETSRSAEPGRTWQALHGG